MMTDADLEIIRKTIKETVNGKIDCLSDKVDKYVEAHAQDMKRILPVVEAYETAQRTGRVALSIGTIITTIGGAWFVLKQIFPQL